MLLFSLVKRRFHAARCDHPARLLAQRSVQWLQRGAAALAKAFDDGTTSEQQQQQQQTHKHTNTQQQQQQQQQQPFLITNKQRYRYSSSR
jgi:hypothetical protein